MENPVTSTALVPVTAVTVWQNVNAQWERLNQNFDQSGDSLNNLQKILERIYEEKNKSFMEGFMRSQQMADHISGKTGNVNRVLADNSDDSGLPKTKKGLISKIQKIMKALDVSGFKATSNMGEKVVGHTKNKKEEAKDVSSSSEDSEVVSSKKKRSKSKEKEKEKDSKKDKDKDKDKKSGFIAKLVASLDISKLFGKVKSLGEKIIKPNATDEDKKKWANIQKSTTNVVGSMGQKAIEALRPALDMLNTAFQSDQMVAAMNFMANIFMVIATVISMVVEGLMYMATVVQQNWDVIGPILGAIAFVLLAAMIGQVYSLAAAWMITNLPILLFVAAIALLIYCLQQAGVSTEEIVSVVAAAFGWLNVFIQNIIIYLYNAFISFADFFRNLFLDPTYAVKKLFYDLATGVLDLFYKMALGTENFAGGFVKIIADAINAALKKFKNLTDFLSNIPGFGSLANIKINYLDTKNPHVFSDLILKQRGKLEAPTSNQPVYDTKKKEYKDPQAVMVDYAQRAKKVTDKFDTKVSLKDYTSKSATPGIKSPADNVSPDINKVGEVGKINDTVDISSEDLKMMRELAEIQAIQNFVELTPTVQVTTGNINNAGDIDTIINKIGQKLNEEFISTAQGVYT
ncbi:hypothetical protein ACFRAM_24260 [Paenibacillus sp. NPDC056722]|uniref:hypothetical protein n=1 Tax=Paenibacillus sp. NPDC056722 TaxID=3345924 RepID=UPI0036917E8F